METMQNVRMTDREKTVDALNAQKFITGVYNTYYCEGATPDVRNTLSRILDDEHRIHEEIFGEMSARGWYTLEKAEDTKLNAAKQSFAKNVHA